MMWILAPFLLAAGVAQAALAATGLKNYPAAKVPGWLLLICSPFPFLFAAFGERVFDALHTPSSFDAYGDLFDSLFSTAKLVIGSVLLCGLLSVWLAVRIRTNRRALEPKGGSLGHQAPGNR